MVSTCLEQAIVEVDEGRAARKAERVQLDLESSTWRAARTAEQRLLVLPLALILVLKPDLSLRWHC